MNVNFRIVTFTQSSSSFIVIIIVIVSSEILASVGKYFEVYVGFNIFFILLRIWYFACGYMAAWVAPSFSNRCNRHLRRSEKALFYFIGFCTSFFYPFLFVVRPDVLIVFPHQKNSRQKHFQSSSPISTAEQTRKDGQCHLRDTTNYIRLSPIFPAR